MDDSQNPAGPVEGAGDEGPQAPPPTSVAQPTAPPAASASGTPGASPQSPNGATAQSPNAPVSLQPKPPTTKRTGLAGVVDDMLDDLAGTKGAAKLKKGDDGNYYVDTPELSRKGQWLKIAGEALHGAAAGAAHMQGPGAAGRGLAAGVEAGDNLGEQRQQQAKDVSGEARQANQDRFNGIKLQHDRAMWAFEEAHAQHQGTEDEIKFNNEEMAREAKPVEQGGLGSQDLGVHANMADLATQMSKTNPKFWKQVYGDTQGSGVVGYKEYGPDGKVTGIHFFARTPGVNGQYVPEDQAYFNVFKPGKTAEDHGTEERQLATVPLTVGQQTAYNAASANLKSQDDARLRKAQEEEQKAEDAHQREQDEHLAAPGQRAHTVAETGKLNTEAAAASKPGAATPDPFGVTSPLPEKEYTKRYDSFGKAYVQPLTKADQQLAQFAGIQSDIDKNGNMTGAESVVGLFNAIGISASPLKGMGFRINSNTVAEHEQARGLGQALYQKLLSLKNGAVVTPQQLKDYSTLATRARESQYVSAIDEARRQGMPVDFLPKGDGKVIDPSTARMYLRAAGGDKAKALQALTQSGWAP